MPTRSELQLADRNSNWKGDKAGKEAIHDWITRRLPRPANCPNCGSLEFIELSCKDHIYCRDLNQWSWLCRSCHSIIDKKIKNILEGQRRFFLCPVCEKIEIQKPRRYCRECAKEVRRIWWKDYNLSTGRTKGYAGIGRPRKEP